MSFRRFVSVLSVCTVATGGLVAAAPKKAAPAKAAPAAAAPAKGPAAGSGAGSAAGSGAAEAGSAAPAAEEAPPADINGTDENPGAPHGTDSETKVEATAPPPERPTGYPIEEALRPITLPQNMSEIAIGPHLQVSPAHGSDALRARYGITNKIQLGLTYVMGGLFDDPTTMANDPGFHPGKAVGLDVTVLLQPWIGVSVGVPVYLNPVAVSVTLGAPIKFQFGDKFAIGGLDDLLNIKIDRFAPTYYQEYDNAFAASQSCDTCNRTEQSRGFLRFSAYGIMQYQPNVAIVGRIGVANDLGSSGGSQPGVTMNGGGTTMFVRAGMDWTPRRWCDLGASLGFDDLAHGGTFTPALYAALRI
jgi:hypothetical protein